MKKSIITILLISISIYAYCQITTRDISEIAVLKPKTYDSISVFNKSEDLRIYIGQELYFLPRSTKYTYFKENEIIGYDGFSLFAKDAGNIKENQYHPIINAHQYDYVSDYKNIAGKYFIIEDFIDQSDKNKFLYNQQGLYFKLVSKELKDTCYYQLDKSYYRFTTSKVNYFILVSHFEYMQKKLLGLKLQLQEDILNVVEINTGQIINCKKDTWWECVDFTVVELEINRYMTPVCILRNENNEEILMEVEKYSANLTVKRKSFMTAEEIETAKQLKELEEKELEEKLLQEELEKKNNELIAKENAEKFKQDCIDKFGTKYGTYIAEGKVVIGMSKEMCRLAWGSPISINKTTNAYGISEQWVYSMKNYLYFDNGILTTIQN